LDGFLLRPRGSDAQLDDTLHLRRIFSNLLRSPIKALEHLTVRFRLFTADSYKTVAVFSGKSRAVRNHCGYVKRYWPLRPRIQLCLARLVVGAFVCDLLSGP